MTIAVAQPQFFKNQMWKVFNVLRNEISTSDYHIVLLLLYLYKEGGLTQLKGVSVEERKQRYNDLVGENLLEHNETLEDLYDQVYLNIIERISHLSFYKLTEALFEIEEDILSKNYVEYFEELLTLIIENLGSYDGEFRTPTEISQFAFELVELPENARIYNPFAGLATYATLLSSSQKYFGQEINLTTYASAILRLFVHDKWESSSLTQGDSIFDWNPNSVDVINHITHLRYRTGEKAKYDLVIANPPFAVKLQEVITGKFGIIKNAESFLIEKGIGSLADNGKLVTLVSNGRLSSGGSELGLRKYLVDDDILEMVVSFPGALLQNTSIPFSIIVINKDKKLKDVVKFIDASSFITRDKRNWTFNGKQLLEDIHSNIENEAIKVISNVRIKKEDFNLSVNRYFIEDKSGIAIGELGEIFATKPPVEKVGHLISNQWLKVDPLNYLVPNNFVPYEQLSKSCRQITESCFLISTTGGKLKVSFLNYDGIPFYISPDIFPFKLVTQLVTPEYFVYQLLSESTLEQLRAYASGSAVQKVTKSDFLRLKLDIPSIENLQESLLHQESVLKGVRDAYILFRENELENERQLLGLKEESTRNFQSMKHTFRQYLSSLKSNTLGTKKFLELNEGKQISLDMLYSKNLGQNLGTHLQNVDALIASLSNLLEDAPEQAKSDIINLSKFVKSFQQKFTFESKFSYRLIVDTESFLDFDSSTLLPLVDFNKQQLDKLFSNIVSNAVNHGFKDDKNYLMDFIIKADDQLIILEIRNNGRPMPSGFGFKDLITRGEKSVDSAGMGLGGSEIKSIVDLYDCVFELDNDPEDTFTVTYRIKFPLAVN